MLVSYFQFHTDFFCHTFDSKVGSTSTRPVHSHLTNFDSGVKSHLASESKKYPDAPDTPAETINIFIYNEIYEIIIVSKNENQIFEAQKILRIFI